MSTLLLVNMLEKIQSRLEYLSESERKAAEVILVTPAQAIHSSIAALALEARVGELTVNCFCRSLETRGFPDFKLHLAQSPVHGTLYVNRNVDEGGSIELYTGKIFESATTSLDQVRRSLDMSVVSRVVDLLTQAKKIAFSGLGSSAATAYDAMDKLFHFNVPTIYSDDIVLQRMSCMNCDDDDVVMIISHTGRTESLMELAQLAREDDAMVIAFTSAGTPLVREATLTITLDVPGDTNIYMSMVSHLAQLTTIDVLATEFMLHRGAKFRDSLKGVREALKESRFDKESFVPGDSQ